MTDRQTWLAYPEAARRVKSSVRTIRNWRSQGMPMEWAQDNGGQRYRVVDEAVLLAWWRQKMHDSPVHFYRMRKRLSEEGYPVPPVPDRFTRRKHAGTAQDVEKARGFSNGSAAPAA